uniref:Uncharacterized protein n=1 Tax=Salix viminalis TaxID=40686 RepID=A0A6N2K4J1_SALVM
MEKKGGFSVTVPAGEEGASSAFLYDGILSLIWSRFKRFLRDSFSRRRRGSSAFLYAGNLSLIWSRGFSATVSVGEEGASSAFLYAGILSLIWSR